MFDKIDGQLKQCLDHINHLKIETEVLNLIGESVKKDGQVVSQTWRPTVIPF
jgi:hypothetical protein